MSNDSPIATTPIVKEDGDKKRKLQEMEDESKLPDLTEKNAIHVLLKWSYANPGVMNAGLKKAGFANTPSQLEVVETLSKRIKTLSGHVQWSTCDECQDESEDVGTCEHCDADHLICVSCELGECPKCEETFCQITKCTHCDEHVCLHPGYGDVLCVACDELKCVGVGGDDCMCAKCESK